MTKEKLFKELVKLENNRGYVLYSDITVHFDDSTLEYDDIIMEL